MTTKNMFKKNDIKIEDIDYVFGAGFFSLKNDRRLLTYRDEYIAARKDGYFYYYEECQCDYGKYGGYLRTTIKFDADKIRIRKTCDYCGRETKQTLKCFDYSDIIPFFAENMNYEKYDSFSGKIHTDINRLILEEIKENIWKYTSAMQEKNNRPYVSFLRQWVKNLSKWENSCSSSIWKAIADVEDDYTFITYLTNNLEYMWD